MENDSIKTSSTPLFEEFDPEIIPWQDQALTKITSANYSLGTHQWLFSGSVGSAKTTLGAHIAAMVALTYPGSGILIGRRTLKMLKRTLLQTLLKHIRNIPYDYNKSDGTIKFPNESTVAEYDLCVKIVNKSALCVFT